MTRETPVGLALCLAVCAAVVAAGCGSAPPAAPPQAAPSVTFNHDRIPAGAPLEITYKFVVAPDGHFPKDYVVMAHIVDTDGELMWTDDHTPPTPTSQWKPGQTVEYTRTIFVPVFPYVGDATMQVGIYSPADPERVPLAGEDTGQRAYQVMRFQLLPQTENLFTVYKDGWHPAEAAANDPSTEWQWTKKEATLAFKNPKKDAAFYLDVDSPQPELHAAQQVTVALGGQVVDQFTLQPDKRVLRKVKLPASGLGDAEMAELRILVDNAFVPLQVNPSLSKDPRQLGVRVFHAHVDAR